MREYYNTPKCSAQGLVVPEGKFPSETPLAMAYIPWQEWEDTYPEDTAMDIGTIFPSLDYPFCGKEGRMKYGKQ
ncbi:MAG: spore coat associated protein CotJA [Oscillospiraceae bacterium]|nr:spore coat associated protein CotJA [Oscillospiraceae bacterium]